MVDAQMEGVGSLLVVDVEDAPWEEGACLESAQGEVVG